MTAAMSDPTTSRIGVNRRFVALTVLHHPDAGRVGARALLPELDAGPVALGRLDPLFARPEGGATAPLDDPFVARRPSLLERVRGGGVRWSRGDHGSGMVADGVPVAGVVELDADRLARGVVVELAQRVVLLLHMHAAESEPLPDYGLVGRSEAMEAVRRAIREAAGSDAPVLVRGTRGAGKERVARAIHEASGRSGAWAAMNVAVMAPSTAASELFGSASGAAGGVRRREGGFRAAREGTLFLDEIGDAPREVQAVLLAALETGELGPGDGGPPERVSARVIAASGTDLRRAAAEGAFRTALLRRLAGVEIQVPPLAERRDDIGRLLYAFLREELTALGLQERLEPRDPESPPWMPAEVVSRLARHSWPGNVRQLRNVARQIVLASRGARHARLDAAVEVAIREPAPSEAPSRRERGPAPPRKRKPSEIEVAELTRVMRECRWKVGPAAEQLGISRASLYELIDRTPQLRRASDVSREELEVLMGELGKSVPRLAERLEVSPRGLKLRMKDLGLD